jgi:branched-chain amino acid aminotransferase
MNQQYFVNGQILPASEAKLMITDLALLRGFGIFDFFRTSNGKPFLMSHYLDRFFASARLMDLQIPYSRSRIEETVLDLIKRNGLKDAGIRMVLTGGYASDGYTPNLPNFFILIEEIHYPDPTYYENGIKLITFEHQREWSEIKSINYLTPIKIRKQIIQKNGYDVLYYHNSNFLEVSRSNFFIIRDGVLITPGKNVLHGVTRKTVIELSKQIMKVEERDIPLIELASAEEVFLTGTTKRILPITMVDNQAIADGKPGSMTKKLINQFYEYENSFVN